MRREDRKTKWPVHKPVKEITILNSSNYGKYFIVSRDLMKALEKSDEIGVRVSKNKRFLYIGSGVDGYYNHNYPQDGKCRDENFVNNIANDLGLDVDNYNRYVFSHLKIKEKNGFPYIIVRIWNKDGVLDCD